MRKTSKRSGFAHVLSQICVLMVMLGGSLTGRGQSSSDALPQPPDIKATSNLVIVPALVSSASKVEIPTLHASEFLLTDNGIPQTVRIEDAEHQPISLLVLMQAGGAAAEQLPLYTKLGTMLSYMAANVPHEIGAVEFDSQPEYVWSFTQNVDGLDDAFEHPDAGDGGAAILDAVAFGIRLLNKRPAGYRGVILLISQAHDEKSHVAADEIVRQLGDNNITIECVTFSPEGKWVKNQLTGPSPENKPYQFAPDVPPLLHTFNIGEPLAVAFRAMRENTSATIAALSGGESFPFSSKKEFDQQLATLTNHFAATYMLSFRPTSKQPGFHSLQLQAAGHPELHVSARRSYWAGDESSSAR